MAKIELLRHVDGALGDPVAADLVPGKARFVDQGDIVDAAETKRVGGAGAGRSRAEHCNGEATPCASLPVASSPSMASGAHSVDGPLMRQRKGLN
jgi:hypothetical protein